MQMNSNQICRACNGEFLYDPNDTSIYAKAAKIDSRLIECGDMFVAIKGENSDGHKYLKDVIQKGVSVVLCQDNIDDDVLDFAEKNNTAVIKVANSQKALQDVSIAWRRNLSAKVLAITGSVAKTTTKNICNDVLSSQFKTTANKGNHNNELGLPMTICRSNIDDEFLITEMGMSAPGEIDELCSFAQPQWGIITNIGDAHIEFLGTRENIAKAKSELAINLPDTIGKLFLWTDDDFRDFIIEYSNIKKRDIKTIFFGSTEYNENISGPQVWYENLEINDCAHPSFIICYKNFDGFEDKKLHCNLNLQGKHNVINACAAVAVGLEAGINIDKIIDVLQLSKPESGRQEQLISKEGFTIINDSYNANPQSMIASLSTFAHIKSKGNKIVFLGDMYELGDYSVTGHKLVGKKAAELAFDYIFCVGELSIDMYKAAKDLGLKDDNIFYFEDSAKAKEKLYEIVKTDDQVLFKASNGMGFQQLIKDMLD